MLWTVYIKWVIYCTTTLTPLACPQQFGYKMLGTCFSAIALLYCIIVTPNKEKGISNLKGASHFSDTVGATLSTMTGFSATWKSRRRKILQYSRVRNHFISIIAGYSTIDLLVCFTSYFPQVEPPGCTNVSPRSVKTVLSIQSGP